MSDVLITPLMNLPNPVPGADPGPDYATNLYNSLNIIDQHNHTVGSGNQINTSGILINADLPFNSNYNATQLRSVRFTSQGAPLAGATDLGCLYVSGADLYYNDENGNQVRITSGGTVNATSSGISSGTATASFSGGVLVVDSNTNTPANIQAGSILIGNNTAGSNFATLSAPNALGSSYQLFLPVIPSGTKFITLDTSGNLSGSVSTAGGITGSNIAASTVTSSNIASGTITSSNIASGTITGSNVASGTITPANITNTPAPTATFGSFTLTTNGSSITVATGSFTSSGTTVTKFLIQGNGSDSTIRSSFTGGVGLTGTLTLTVDSSVRQIWNFQNAFSGASTIGMNVSWPFTLSYIDTTVRSAGTHTYNLVLSLSITGSTGGTSFSVSGGEFIITEL